MLFEVYLQQATQRINDYLDRWMNNYLSACLEEELPSKLWEAMRYSLENGGKRLRSCLIYSIGNALQSRPETLAAPAAAVELIHSYSLIHDDLPAIDNDDWRRGKPSCHKAFDEATAILAGDALQTMAFELLSHPHYNPVNETIQLQMIKTLAQAIGFQGMVGGQALDITYEKRSASLSILRQIHRKKTGALIVASVQLAALAAGCQDSAILAQLKCYADNMGLAYQVQDDLLDIEGSLEQLGKTPGQDIALNKATFPALLGIQAAKEQVKQLYQDALKALESIFDLERYLHLKQLSEFLVYRTY